ncbi:hypothetical protein LY474_18520 [Myxococcus stipitatus]|uniref:hypothetical protein n=1 Tax=Myxococcus stipitatus TaxID=83455 RepID=UPI001F1C65E6|nr:hypothetical protein [Myxococcus stipitatus]MCE9669795.1 hypothetical protein [Myxococcus stipitatus]
MKIQTGLIAVVGVVLSSGCASVRTSSSDHLAARDSEVFLQGGVEDATRRITEVLSKRGLNVTEKQPQKDGSSVYTFKGNRTDLTTVTGGGDIGVYGSTNSVGSFIFARFEQQEDDVTRVSLLGKPAIDGKVVCSDAAPAWVPGCTSNVYTGALWHGRARMTGKDEAEVIRGIILELEMSPASGPGSVVARKPEPDTKPTCVASEHPNWANATAVQKKKLLEMCRATAARAADSR